MTHQHTPAKGAECSVCLIPHDPATHAATLRLHRKFRAYVLMSIEKPPRTAPQKLRNPGAAMDCSPIHMRPNLPRRTGAGRPAADITAESIGELLAKGLTYPQVAEALGSSTSVLYRAMAKRKGAA